MSTDRVTLEVALRVADQLGSRNVRRLRSQGLIPGILYGKGNAAAFVVGERELRAALTGPSGTHAIVDVVLDGSTHPAIVKDVQRHPIRGTLTHIDFHEVRLDRPIETSVALELVGDAPGARMGGVVQLVTREVRIQALPTAIPEKIEVATDALELGDSIRLAEVTAPEGVAILDDPETVVANCLVPRTITVEEVEGEAAEGEEGAEPSAEAEGEPEAGDTGEEG
jgi:large subunit ribosomal protein L25